MGIINDQATEATIPATAATIPATTMPSSTMPATAIPTTPISFTRSEEDSAYDLPISEYLRKFLHQCVPQQDISEPQSEFHQQVTDFKQHVTEFPQQERCNGN